MADENENGGLTHFDAHGQARMVDVTEKATTSRVAVAEGRITMALETADTIRAGTIRKGDVLGVARLAAIQAAKRTDALIPLCHQAPSGALSGRACGRCVPRPRPRSRSCRRGSCCPQSLRAWSL